MNLSEIRANLVKETLEVLGGIAKYEEIYNLLRDNPSFNHENIENEVSFQATVRDLIQKHSSDSESYNSRNPDLFYSVDGKGKGIWGLREYYAQNEIASAVSREEVTYPEGREFWKKHKAYERNYSLINEAKKQYMKNNDEKLDCQICGFNFEDKYGKLGAGYIEAHHILPISESKEMRESTINDLLMVCSNCHRILHRTSTILKEDFDSILIKPE